MRVARIIYYSQQIDGYVHAIAAMVRQFHPNRIEVAFLNEPRLGTIPHRGREQSEFVDKLHSRLAQLGKDFQAYREAETIEIIPMTIESGD